MRAKIFTTIAILFTVVTANAQINKGGIFLGGSFNYNDSKLEYADPSYTNYKNEQAEVTIQIGKIIKDNTVIGVIASYNYTRYSPYPVTDSDFVKYNIYSAGVFYRKYKKLLKNFYFFGEADGLYTHENIEQKNSSVSSDTKSKSNGGVISFVPGVAYAMGKKMHIELLMPNLVSISYSHFTSTTLQGNPQVEANGKGHSFEMNGNLNTNFLSNFGIGLKFIFGT